MGRGCLCSEGRIIETTSATAGGRYGDEDYREESNHHCFGKIVNEDPSRDKCIRRCDVCGKLYEADR